MAITGIVANASHYGGNYLRDTGFVKGTLYAFFTFFLPNLFMNSVLVSKSHMVNLALGIVFIYILDIMVRGLSYYYIHSIVKYDEKEKEE